MRESVLCVMYTIEGNVDLRRGFMKRYDQNDGNVDFSSTRYEYLYEHNEGNVNLI